MKEYVVDLISKIHQVDIYKCNIFQYNCYKVMAPEALINSID